MYRPPRTAQYMPEPEHVAMADRRLDGFIEAWAHSGTLDLRILLRSAYLQGLADMADAAVQMNARAVETAKALEAESGKESR